ncbi:MAG: glycogen/starch/alpha-glucan phosphorylase [Lachnospiraceae bacterium]
MPQLMPIIEKLDELARTRTGNESLRIIDRGRTVHMAHMDIHFTHSTNGWRALHAEIPQKFRDCTVSMRSYPEKFKQ